MIRVFRKAVTTAEVVGVMLDCRDDTKGERRDRVVRVFIAFLFGFC